MESLAELWLAWRGFELLGNALGAWLLALAVAAAAYGVALVAKWLVLGRLAAVAARTATELDDLVVAVVGGTRRLLLVFPALFLGALVLTLPPRLGRALEVVAVLALLLQAGLWGVRAVDFWSERYRRRRLDTDAAAVTTFAAVGFLGKLALWTVVLLLALENLGFDVTALIAGLGVGGIAVALAAQNILGDLFSSLSIVVDKPFIIGDAIQVGGDFVGRVEHIGLKTTRLRSVSGEEIVFSNSDLLQSRIRNFKRMQERRVLFGFGVTYETPAAALARIPEMLREVIEAVPGARFERAHFRGLGPSSLDFEVVFWVDSADFLVALDAQQAVNLALVRRFAAEHIDFAFPTQTLKLERVARVESPAEEGRATPGTASS